MKAKLFEGLLNQSFLHSWLALYPFDLGQQHCLVGIPSASPLAIPLISQAAPKAIEQWHFLPPKPLSSGIALLRLFSGIAFPQSH